MEKTTVSNRVVFIILLIFYGLYLIVNHRQVEEPIEAPFIIYEEDIPFLPWTIVIYLSLFFQAVIFIKIIPEKVFWLVIELGFAMLVIHLATFILFPIRYPRENYQSDDLVLNLFRFIDTPKNCFPSLHVSCTIFFANLYVFWEKSDWRKFFMVLWSILITLSVLTVKQHYIWDILGSVLVTRLFIIMPFEKKLQIHINKS
jgi:hypothetical protein